MTFYDITNSTAVKDFPHSTLVAFSEISVVNHFVRVCTDFNQFVLTTFFSSSNSMYKLSWKSVSVKAQKEPHVE